MTVSKSVRFGLQVIGLALVSLSLVACSTTGIREDLDTWIGKHGDELVKTFGPPTSCSSLSSGEQVCMWATAGFVVSGGTGGTIHSQTIFAFDKDGIVRRWKYVGPPRGLHLLGQTVTLSSENSVAK